MKESIRVGSLNPFQCVLKLSNLPASVQPIHIRHILTHPPKWGGRKKVDPGIELIQIYTIPIPSKATRFSRRRYSPSSSSTSTPNTSKSSLPNIPSTRTSLGSLESTDTQESSITAIRNTQTVVREVGFDENTESLSTVERTETSLVEMDTVAYIHFRGESYLWLASRIFINVTIDGLPPVVKIKRFTSAPFRRLIRRIKVCSIRVS
ncbi:hypothetical protein M231_07005 [Tremella mesenterica]|uniref:Uncharacterized protein n=1 Tax=Tremella mesenterica TaxID=5217 RepID=A0A4Q1BD10_TREME|nr:hypothetical protein M231_07005 [Tremella mesenterica]